MKEIYLLESFCDLFINRLDYFDAGGAEEIIFKIDEYYVDKIAKEDIIIDVSPEDLLNETKHWVRAAKIKIDSQPNLKLAKVKRRNSIGDLLGVKYMADGERELNVHIHMYESPKNRKLVKVLDAMRAGRSMALNTMVIAEDLFFVDDFIIKEILGAVYALARRLERGGLNEDLMRSFYEDAAEKTLDFEPEDVNPFIVLSVSSSLLEDVEIASTEQVALSRAYMGAAALFKLSKEIPIIRHLEGLKDLLDVVEKALDGLI